MKKGAENEFPDHGDALPSEPPGEFAATPEPLRLDSALAASLTQARIQALLESGWHPLLRLRVTDYGAHQKVEAYDPIGDRPFRAVTKSADVSFEDSRPTFARVARPDSAECEIEQLDVATDGSPVIALGGAWLGASSTKDILVLKRAHDGDHGAARRVARAFSFDILERYRLANLKGKVRIDAAKYWYERAINGGSLEACFEYAYLCGIESEDISTNGNFFLIDLEGFLGMLRGRTQLCDELHTCKSSMDGLHIRNRISAIDQNLRSMLRGRGTEKLKEVLEDYLKDHPVL